MLENMKHHLRKNIKNPNSIETCKHFNNNEHKFSKHGKFNSNLTVTECKHYPQNIKIEIERKKNFLDQEI